MVVRRHVLKTSGGALAALAGCVERYMGGSARGGPGADGFTEWLVDPAIANTGREPLVAQTAPATIAEHSRTIHRDDWDEYRESIAELVEFERFRPEELDQLLVYGLYPAALFVLWGDFDRERITDRLRREDYLPGREHEDFELYRRDSDQEGEEQAVGVNDDTIVVAWPGEEGGGERIVEYAIDASIGEERTYTEVNADFDALQDASPTGHLMTIDMFERHEETVVEQGQFRNAIGMAESYTLDDEESGAVLSILFLDERDVFIREIEDWTREHDAFLSWRGVEVSEDGRIVTVEGHVPTRDVLDSQIL